MKDFKEMLTDKVHSKIVNLSTFLNRSIFYSLTWYKNIYKMWYIHKLSETNQTGIFGHSFVRTVILGMFLAFELIKSTLKKYSSQTDF